ncbi:MAG TPA: hypothetical protein VGJ26_17935 [Pirellulales bacterium]|jgi:Arc/MetJ-type ribon-helix-helix transcriptional regulator
MDYQFPPDVDRMLRDRMAAGGYSSEDEVLRDALGALADRIDDLAALQAGIDDWRAGRVKSLAEVDAEVRKSICFGSGRSDVARWV